MSLLLNAINEVVQVGKVGCSGYSGDLGAALAEPVRAQSLRAPIANLLTVFYFKMKTHLAECVAC